MATQAAEQVEERLASRYAQVRRLSCELAAPLSDADATIQPHDDASPAKWHLAHTSWFFETFLLRDHVTGYRPHDERWAFLFNSYYEAEGQRHARPRRGMLSRPSLDELLDYRAAVDRTLLQHIDALPPELVELGLQHEQQHQELMLMDMKAAMFANPLRAAIWEPRPAAVGRVAEGAGGWTPHGGGLVEIGHDGRSFAFDCETPRHRTYVAPFRLADRLVSNADWLRFIDAGGYRDPLLWLADGWAWVQAERVEAPLYWERRDGGWWRFGLDGMRPVDPARPVSHVSYYEADAFARWAGARLPTEAEWEAAAAGADPEAGVLLDTAGPVEPEAGAAGLFGNVWQWTASAYLAYPGFRPAAGAVGEYNGKFMCGQMVLRGGSCATPRGHVRASYRNFFYPHQRWMFSGVRLAQDA